MPQHEVLEEVDLNPGMYNGQDQDRRRNRGQGDPVRPSRNHWVAYLVWVAYLAWVAHLFRGGGHAYAKRRPAGSQNHDQTCPKGWGSLRKGKAGHGQTAEQRPQVRCGGQSPVAPLGNQGRSPVSPFARGGTPASPPCQGGVGGGDTSLRVAGPYREDDNGQQNTKR